MKHGGGFVVDGYWSRWRSVPMSQVCMFSLSTFIPHGAKLSCDSPDMEQPRRLVPTRHRSRAHTHMCGVTACQPLRSYFYRQRSSVIDCMRRTELFVLRKHRSFRPTRPDLAYRAENTTRSSHGMQRRRRSNIGSGACKRRLPNQALHTNMAHHTSRQ